MTAVCEVAARRTSRAGIPARGDAPAAEDRQRPAVSAPVRNRQRIGGRDGMRSVDARRVRSCRLAHARTEAMVARSGGLRLTRRGRLVVRWLALVACASIAVVVLVGVGSGATGAWGADRAEPAEEAPNQTVTVQPGDTLWQVAARVAPEHDRRVVVDAIVDRNDLAGAGDLQVGERLVVPRP